MNDETRREIWALCRVSRPDIFILRYTLEAHEGLCVSSTLPGGEGLVRVYTSVSQKAQLEKVLDGLTREMSLEIVEWGQWE